MLAAILTQERRALSIDDASWLSMGAYLRLFTGTRPEPISARTLMIRAAEPLGGETARRAVDGRPPTTTSRSPPTTSP
ncbi:hypothetical protein NKH77_44095 [Streptomyces sp. M19]